MRLQDLLTLIAALFTLARALPSPASPLVERAEGDQAQPDVPDVPDMEVNDEGVTLDHHGRYVDGRALLLNCLADCFLVNIPFAE